nr:serine/threonine-protein kinase [Kofleriaceae bacterium]
MATEHHALDTLRDAEGSPLPAAVTPGARVGQYELIRELGRGGMGLVMLARDTRLGRRVAIKFLVTNSDELTERFLVEARTTALLNHENIVVVHEVGEVERIPYMVLEYLEGTPLRRLLEDGRLGTGRVVEIATAILRALVRAHDAGIVHRDLKPENVIVTDAGAVKVLDFGIAKLLARGRPVHDMPRAATEAAFRHTQTSYGALVGTLPYMSPEQLGTDAIDHRSDLWALGVMLFEMLVGAHPLAGASSTSLIAQIADPDEAMPRIADRADAVPDALARIVDRCLTKAKADRYASARDVLADLELLTPGRTVRALGEHDSPYPGLVTFQEADADRFFGRDHDAQRMVARIREHPLVGVVGPSGVGKSSFVRAAVVPALRASGEAWEIHVLRPGRRPLAGLASALGLFATNPTPRPGAGPPTGDFGPIDRLTREPGYLGAVLRDRAARRQTRILLFVDQFEELYTQVADVVERRAYTACLAAAADDVSAPVRVVVSMRSDFLDRLGEDLRFVDELARGLEFLQPLGPAALRDALVQPLEARSFRFEDPAMVDDMLAVLAATPGALPLLQFAASRLWETRDRTRKVLTRDSYDAMGGISGALAAHADQVLATLAPAAQRHARAIFLRLVTLERTRAVVERRELHGLAADVAAIESVVDHLVAARLLVVQGDAAGASVEIVHESLVTSWPTLRRWLDEGQEDSAQLAQLRTAAAQWERKGRIQGLLWRGEALVEAKRWHARYRGELPARERDFLAAVFTLGTRASRIKRATVIGVIAFLSLAVIGSAVAMISIRDAEQSAEAAAETAADETRHAEAEQARAQTEAEHATQAAKAEREALARVTAEQDATRRAEDGRASAEASAAAAGATVKTTQAELEAALARAERERAVAVDQAAKAGAAALAAKKAQDEANRLYQTEKARREAAEKQRSKISTQLQ